MCWSKPKLIAPLEFGFTTSHLQKRVCSCYFITEILGYKAKVTSTIRRVLSPGLEEPLGILTPALPTRTSRKSIFSHLKTKGTKLPQPLKMVGFKQWLMSKCVKLVLTCDPSLMKLPFRNVGAITFGCWRNFSEMKIDTRSVFFQNECGCWMKGARLFVSMTNYQTPVTLEVLLAVQRLSLLLLGW